jgi:replicative DNA helicase
MAQCPAHEDSNPSLSVKVGTDGRVLLNCHHGCAAETIVAQLGLTMADLFEPKDEPLSKPTKVAEYRYVDADGNLLFVKERYVPKTFRVRRATGEYSLGDAPRVLYRLPELIAGVAAGRTVWIVEGEKDADRLAALGEVATCNFDGASAAGQRPKWRASYNQWLAGAAQVVIIRDRDVPGHAHARAVAESINGSVRRLDVREAIEGNDLSDHLAAGHRLDELVPVDLYGTDAPPPTDAEAPDDPEDRRQQIAARFVSGATFVLDSPEGVQSVWGEDDDVLWARGETLLLVGPPGVGKTTLAGQLLRARLGGEPGLLGWPVAPTVSRVLYLAMDRPPQIARSMRRVFREEDRELLNERLVVWRGPPEVDMAKDTGLLTEMAAAADADTVVLDSVKDAAIRLSDDEIGAGLNQAFQRALVAGVEVLGLHHQTKRSGSGTGKPDTLADVYGSAWITAGAGSVILLWGNAGDSVVELKHLKQPAEDVGPLQLIHDHAAGRTVVHAEVDLLQVVANNSAHGLAARAAAHALFASEDPTDNEVEKARRRLKGLAAKGLVIAKPGPPSAAGGKPEMRFFPTTLRAVQQ